MTPDRRVCLYCRISPKIVLNFSKSVLWTVGYISFNFNFLLHYLVYSKNLYFAGFLFNINHVNYMSHAKTHVEVVVLT